MARAGLFHPDFMDKVKSKTIAAWKRKAAGSRTPKPRQRIARNFSTPDTAGWHLVFHDDFDRKELGDKWTVIDGKWSVADGALIGSGTLISTRGFPADNAAGFQRLEFEAVDDVAGELQSQRPEFLHSLRAQG